MSYCATISKTRGECPWRGTAATCEDRFGGRFGDPTLPHGEKDVAGRPVNRAVDRKVDGDRPVYGAVTTAGQSPAVARIRGLRGRYIAHSWA